MRGTKVLLAAMTVALTFATARVMAQSIDDQAAAFHASVQQKYATLGLACGVALGLSTSSQGVAIATASAAAARLTALVGVAVTGTACYSAYLDYKFSLKQGWLKLPSPEIRTQALRHLAASELLGFFGWVFKSGGDGFLQEAIPGAGGTYLAFANALEAAERACLNATAEGADPNAQGSCAYVVGDGSPRGNELRRRLAARVQFNACLGRERAVYAGTPVSLEVEGFIQGKCQAELERAAPREISVALNDLVISLGYQNRPDLPYPVAVPTLRGPAAPQASQASAQTIAALQAAGALANSMFVGPDGRLYYQTARLPAALESGQWNNFSMARGVAAEVLPRVGALGAQAGKVIDILIRIGDYTFLVRAFDPKSGTPIARPAEGWLLYDPSSTPHRVSDFNKSGGRIGAIDRNGNLVSIPLAPPRAFPDTERSAVVSIIAGEFVAPGLSAAGACRANSACVYLPTGAKGALEAWSYSQATGVYFRVISREFALFIGPDGQLHGLRRDPNGQLSIVTENENGTLRIDREVQPGVWESRTAYPGGYYDDQGNPRFAWCLPPYDDQGHRLCNRMDGGGWYTAVDGKGTPDPRTPPPQYSAAFNPAADVLGGGQSLGQMLFGSFYDGAFVGIRWNLSQCTANACSNNPGATTTCYGQVVPVQMAGEICGRLAREAAEEAIRKSYRYDFEVLEVSALPTTWTAGERRTVRIKVKNKGGEKTFPWAGPFYGLTAFFAQGEPGTGTRRSTVVAPLAAGQTVAPEGEREFLVELVAPGNAGRYDLRIRMVKDVASPGWSAMGYETTIKQVDVQGRSFTALNGVTYLPAVKPGEFIAAFGAGLAAATVSCAAADPRDCPPTAADRSVLLSNRDATVRAYTAVSYASPAQINVLVPGSLPAGDYEISVWDAATSRLVGSDAILVLLP